MAEYHVRYVSHADEQRSQLPRSSRTAFDATVENLVRDPHVVGDYDEREGSYTTAFGGMGLILYVVSDEIVTVTIIRVIWGQW